VKNKYGIFADALELPDELWSAIEPTNATTKEQEHFVKVLLLHFDYENGGLNQVMYNFRNDIPDYANSFAEIGLVVLADILLRANGEMQSPKSWEGVFGKERSNWERLYSSIAYGNPFRNEKGFEEFEPTVVDGYYQYTDWVARSALKYARDNWEKFPAFREIFDL